MKDGYFKVKYYLCLALVVILVALTGYVFACSLNKTNIEEPIYATVNTTALIEAGYIESESIEEPTISIDTAIEYLENARYSHQYYINHPEKDARSIDKASGNVSMEHHVACVERYTAIIELLESMR